MKIEFTNVYILDWISRKFSSRCSCFWRLNPLIQVISRSADRNENFGDNRHSSPQLVFVARFGFSRPQTPSSEFAVFLKFLEFLFSNSLKWLRIFTPECEFFGPTRVQSKWFEIMTLFFFWWKVLRTSNFYWKTIRYWKNNLK